MTFAAGFLLLLWVVASILTNGIALLHCLTKLRGLDLFGYGAAAGVLLHALLGCAIAAAPAWRWAFLALLIALTLLSTACFVARRVVQELSRALSRPSKISLALWGLLLVLSLGLLHLDVRLPEPLPDGLYVLKTQTTNVKIQHLTSLPADNYIPFAVAEFFLRGVSFKKERPILPANEVSNRTILMSLVALPFRAALGAPHDHPQLGTYNYVGSQWPDVSKLDTGGSFEQFAVVGLVLNSLMLLGIFVFCSSLGANPILPLATLLYVTNPYFIAQTVYTWPKALAGFFILLAWTSIRGGHGPVTVAALLALAYHCHPYVIVFAGCAALFYLTQWRREKTGLPAAVIYLLVFGLILAPWIVWTRFVLQIPSDLVMQNFAGPGTEAAWVSPISFIWVRLYNLFCLTGSMMFSVYPFDFRTVLNQWLFSVPGVVGLVMIYPALAQCAELPKPRPWLWYGLLGPALLILAVYSCPALPVLHGYQPLLGTLLFFGVWWLSRHCTRTVCIGLVGLQLLFNLSLVLARGLITGARF
ncbi:MAG TPA: hypothetical protein VNP98_09795 [Chthoniobacterales bacterium]|nr:hypothetical protein [Chthoniobacterales bacterium]